MSEWAYRGRVLIVVEHAAAGPIWQPRPGLERLTGAYRERAAAWLAADLGLEHDESYHLLWSRG